MHYKKMISMWDSFCDKVIEDLTREFSDSSVTEFEIVPATSAENKNSSPVIRGGNSLGLESWAVRHILPYANRKFLELTSKAMAETIGPYLLVANLLLPDMSTAWNRRKDLICRKRMTARSEMRLTRMTLSRKPKCNDALAHRRWLIAEKHVVGDDETLLREELNLVTILADRYHSNYHAWTHRQWCLNHFAPVSPREKIRSTSILSEMTKRKICRLFTSTSLPVYVSELETNKTFFASHVSDHSGLHFRNFLVTRVISILLSDSNNNVRKLSSDCDVERKALLFFSMLTEALLEFFQSNGPLHTQSYDYLNRLQYKVNTFDIIIGLLVLEMKCNYSLNSLYEDHEALWCYRRFLIVEFESLLVTLKKYCNNNYESNSLNNTELNGSIVCCCKNCEIVVIYAGLLRVQENAILNSNSSLRSMVNYSKWFKRVSKVNQLQ